MTKEGGITLRKRTINFCVDKILWGVIMLLPILLYVIYLISIKDTAVQVLGFEPFLQLTGLYFENMSITDVVSSSPVAKMFYNIFEAGFEGIGYLTGDSYVISWYMYYLIMVEFLHLCVDVILIIPRVCRKFFDKFRSDE